MGMKFIRRKSLVSCQTNAVSITSAGAMAGTKSQTRCHGMVMGAMVTTSLKKDIFQLKKMTKMCTGRDKDGAGIKTHGNTIPTHIETIGQMQGKDLLLATQRIKVKKLLKMMTRPMILSQLLKLKLQRQQNQLLSQKLPSQ